MTAASSVPAAQDYRLAHCEGYRVDSNAGEVGRVEEVWSALGEHPDLLVLRTGRFGRRRLLLPTEEVLSVLPWEARIVVRSPVRILASALR